MHPEYSNVEQNNPKVTSMLLLGGAATVEALTGVDYRLASFLIPWYVRGVVSQIHNV